MKNILLILLIIGSIKLTSGADFTQNVRGTVIDEITEQPLIGATLILIGSSPITGTTTDANGEFVLENLPIGRQSIEISYVGYESKVVPNLLLTSAKEITIVVRLQESVIGLDEVTVKATKRKDIALNEMAMVSARTFSVEETERFAGSLGDPARMVANYAGVMTQNDSRNDIIIRGNSPVGVMWRMEGIEIPNPNHFGALGTTGGPVSMVNNNLLANSDFLTGAFPAEFGNATSGVFDLNMRSGNNQQMEFTGQIGFNGFEGGMEGPFIKRENNPNPSYLVNYRYSFLDAFENLGFDMGTGAAIPEYQDLTLNLDIPGTKFGRFKIIGLWGKSNIELGRDLSDSTGNAYNTKGTATNFGSDLAVVGLAHTCFLNAKSRLKSTLSYQNTSSATKFDSIRYSTESFDNVYGSKQTEEKLSFSTQYRYKYNSKNNMSLGVIADKYMIDYVDSVYSNEHQMFIKPINVQGDMYLFRGYGQWQHKFSDQVTSYLGLLTQYFAFNHDLAIEPRASIEWQLNSKHSFTAGYGKHSQIQPKVIYFYEDYDETTDRYNRTNEDVKFTRSDHYILGYNYLINSGFRLKVETYYQYLYDVPVKESFKEISLINAGDFFGIPSDDSLVNKGTGTNYGVEITLEKFLSKGYYFLFTTSLFDSKYKGYDGVSRNTAFNGNYVFNLLGGYEYRISEKLMLTFDLKTVLAGGRRYIPVDVPLSMEKGEEERIWEDAYKNKYNDYFRTDFRIGIKNNKRKFSQEWGLDIQNVTNHQNLFMESLDLQKGETYKVFQQGFYPMMLYRIQF